MGRSSKGCIPCRLRRKKCSEEKPTCINCTRNCLLCTYPSSNNQEHVQLLRRTNPSRSGSITTNSTRSALRSPVTSFSTSSGVASPDNTSLLPEEILWLIQTRLPYSIDPMTALTSSVLRSTASKRLFHHYLHRTHKIMAVCRGTNSPFLKELIPMALSDQLILNALLAVSGIHHADIGGVDIEESTWVHYGQAIQGEKYGLTLLAQGDRDVLIPLTITAMLLCIAETFKPDAGNVALQHLKAARYLLQDVLELPDSNLSQETRSFLAERYAYTMILAHITMGESSDEWVLKDTERFFLMNRESTRWSQSGCVHELFQLIPRVSVLARRQQQQEETDDEEARRSEYLQLQSTITAWHPSSEDEVHKLCGYMYQQALHVYLLSTCEQVDSSCYPQPLQDAFDLFIPFLNSIPDDSPISTTMCWPLAVFGSCARRPEHQAIIRERLDQLSIKFSRGSVRETRILLDELWRRDDPWLANPLGFRKVMREQEKIILFL